MHVTYSVMLQPLEGKKLNSVALNILRKEAYFAE